MGLEAFKTEGPRTRTKSKDKKSASELQVVHVLRGTDPDTSMLPRGINTHEVVCSEQLKGVTIDETVDRFVCRECSSVSTEFETKLKVDKLEYQHSSWYNEFMEEALEAANNTDREDTLDDFSKEDIGSSKSTSSSSSDSDDSDDEPSTGLMSFKS